METKSGSLAVNPKDDIIFCIIYFHQIHLLCNALPIDKITGGCVGIANCALLFSKERKTKLLS